MSLRRALTLIGALAFALMNVSCGAGDEPSSTAEPEAQRQEACAPVPGDRPDRIDEATSQGVSTELELSKSSVGFTVLRSTRRLSVAGHFGQADQFRAPKDVVFIAVTYGIENRGPAALEPSRAVNRVALIQDERGRTWHTADAPRACGPISASLAKVQGISNPENDVAPEETATTAAVFSVPSRADGLRFLIPGQNFAVRLGPAV
jgi:hypothetical protein